MEFKKERKEINRRSAAKIFLWAENE